MNDHRLVGGVYYECCIRVMNHVEEQETWDNTTHFTGHGRNTMIACLYGDCEKNLAAIFSVVIILLLCEKSKELYWQGNGMLHAVSVWKCGRELRGQPPCSKGKLCNWDDVARAINLLSKEELLLVGDYVAKSFS